MWRMAKESKAVIPEDAKYIRLDPDAEKCMRVNSVIRWVILAAAVTAASLFFIDHTAVKTAVIAAVWIIAVIYVIIVPHMRYERYRYYIDEEAIKVTEGFLWIEEQMVPMERLHKLSTSQGPVERIFGLSEICVTTAGGDVTIKYLKEDTAEKISESLKKRINLIVRNQREN